MAARPGGIGIDGPQWVLEQWGDRNTVFQFVRVEDIAYDKRPGMSNVVYIADSGRGSTNVPRACSRPQTAGSGGWRSTPLTPTKVLSLRVLVEGDNATLKLLSEIHQPDNIETTANGSLLVTEDPGQASSSCLMLGPAERDRGSALGRDLTSWSPTPDAAKGRCRGDQELDEEPDTTSTRGSPADSGQRSRSPGLGAWESSGIVDASEAFGDGAFLIDVEAHTLWRDMAPGRLNAVNPPATADFTYKREGGQLLLLRLPGI